MRSIGKFAGLGCAALLLLGAPAHADVLVYAGYYDLPPPDGGNSNPLPNPWFGSANTTFDGDTTLASSGDPDESALMFTNTGGSAVSLSALSVSWGANNDAPWNSFLAQTIDPGWSVIFSGTSSFSFDGSDLGLMNASIAFTLDSNDYSVDDNNSVLFGGPTSANETMPWTLLSCIGSCGVTPPSDVPESGTLSLTAAGILMLAGFGFTRRRHIWNQT